MHCTESIPCGKCCIPADHVCHKETRRRRRRTPEGHEEAAEAASAAPLRPDPTKTPGDVLTTDPAVICVKGYTKTVRSVPESVREQVFRMYGIPGAGPASSRLIMGSPWSWGAATRSATSGPELLDEAPQCPHQGSPGKQAAQAGMHRKARPAGSPEGHRPGLDRGVQDIRRPLPE